MHHDLDAACKGYDGVLPTFTCREDAPKVFRRYWEYTLPIRKFMADTSEEAIQVTAVTNHPPAALSASRSGSMNGGAGIELRDPV